MTDDKREWLEARQTIIGGSDVAAILGCNPWKTALDVYNSKIGEPTEIPDNPAMKAGRKLEQVVAEYYEEESGRKVQRSNLLHRHKKYPFLGGNIDRVILADDSQPKPYNERGILECKTTVQLVREQWEQQIPVNYYCQLQHYLYVTGLSWGAFAVLSSGRYFDTFPVQRDDEYLENVQVPALVKFWTEHVEAKKPPAFQLPDLEKVIPKLGSVIEATDEIHTVWADLCAAKSEKKDCESRVEELENKVKEFMNDREALTGRGIVLATWKSIEQERIDTKKLKDERPEVAAEYIKKQQIRKFLVKIPKGSAE